MSALSIQRVNGPLTRDRLEFVVNGKIVLTLSPEEGEHAIRQLTELLGATVVSMRTGKS